MTDTQEDKATRGRGLTPGHWIGIATIVKGGPKLDQSGGGKLDHPAARWRV